MVHDIDDGAGDDFLDGGDAFAFGDGGAFVELIGRLGLPAVVARAAVGDGEFVALGGHGCPAEPDLRRIVAKSVKTKGERHLLPFTFVPSPTRASEKPLRYRPSTLLRSTSRPERLSCLASWICQPS